MAIDSNGNLEVYPDSSTNPQSFILPQTEEELDGMNTELGIHLYHNGTMSVFIDEDTREILYYELDTNDDIQIQILTNFDLPANANCSESQTSIANRGYLWNPHDWKNFEATIWVEVIDVDNTNGFVEISGREGYKETTSSRCCVGTSYSVRAYWATSGANKAKTETVKTEWYKSEIPKNTQQVNVVPDFRQQLIGLKMAVYNTVESNRNTVVIEHYICPDYDTRDINWTRVSQVRDFVGANWNANGLQCNAPTKDYPIFWGGYFVSFRWAGAKTIQFKDLSVREIELEDPDGGNGGGGGDPDPDPDPPAPINNILWTSIGSWDNGHDRTFSAFDPDDRKLEMRAGDNREMHIDGEGNGFQSGARGRQYIYVNNYNASMEFFYTPNASIDNLSLRIRSRHNEGGSCGNAFGGYGCVIRKNVVEFGDETCHDGGTHRDFGSNTLSPALVNGQEYIFRFSCFDVTNGVKLTCDMWKNNAWVQVGSAVDTHPTSAMIDKDLYMEKSYFWIRTNNENGNPQNVKLRNEIMRNLDVEGTPPPPPDPDCPSGQHKNTSGDCVPNEVPCPTGQHRDANDVCVDDPVGQTPCPTGQFRDVNGNCVPQPTTCPAGYQKNAQGVCVPIIVPPQNPPPNQPPAIPASFKRSITFKRNIINNSLCECIGIDPGTGSGGGGEQPTEFEWVYESQFGTNGSGDGQFLDPHDIAIDSSGNLYVADPGRNDIQKFTPLGVYVSKFTNAAFVFPYGIGIDTDDNIIVADSQAFKVFKFTNSGTLTTTISSVPVTPSDLDSPEAVAFDPVNGDVYVCDARKHRILKFDKNLNFILTWGSLGTADNQFDHPHGIAVDADRNVYVVQSGVALVKVYDMLGNFITKWGSAGTTDGKLLTPLEHMDIDNDGRLFIVNNDVRPVVQVFNSSGGYLTKFGSETPGSGNGQFTEPENCRINEINHKAYVVDRENQRIQVFKRVPKTTGGGTGGGLRKIYDVSPNNGTKVKLASVVSQKTEYYLQYGQVIEKSSSVFNNVTVKRIKIWIAERLDPIGATGNGVHVVIRDKNDNIMVDFGYIDEDAIVDAGSWHTVERLDNTYRCKVEDRIFFEFDGGDPTDYEIIFRKSNQPKTGSKVIYRNNDMDEGEYSRRDYDICMIVEGE